MAQLPDPPPSDPVTDAIERVLKTERDGMAALHRSELAAQALLAEARARAAAITRRADACISRLHGAYLHKVAQEIQALAAAHPASADADAPAYEPAALRAAAERIAAKLAGGP